MSEAQHHIALALLERTAAYINFFVQMNHRPGDEFTETETNAIKFVDEIIKFLREVKRV